MAPHAAHPQQRRPATSRGGGPAAPAAAAQRLGARNAAQRPPPQAARPGAAQPWSPEKPSSAGVTVTRRGLVAAAPLAAAVAGGPRPPLVDPFDDAVPSRHAHTVQTSCPAPQLTHPSRPLPFQAGGWQPPAWAAPAAVAEAARAASGAAASTSRACAAGGQRLDGPLAASFTRSVYATVVDKQARPFPTPNPTHPANRPPPLITTLHPS
jgi:hypothetical protein